MSKPYVAHEPGREGFGPLALIEMRQLEKVYSTGKVDFKVLKGTQCSGA